MRIIIDDTILHGAFFEKDYYCEKIFIAAKEKRLEIYISTFSFANFIIGLPQQNTYSFRFLEELVNYPNFKIINIEPKELIRACKKYLEGKDLLYSINVELLYKYSFNFYVTKIEKYNDEKVISPKSFVVSYL